jgi:putative multiple sugar transport system substrate-binding protein
MTVFKDVRTLVNDAIAAAVALPGRHWPPELPPALQQRRRRAGHSVPGGHGRQANVQSALIDSGYYSAS